MPPSAFTSPAVTAASRCCSASVRRTRFAASLRPGGRPSGFLSDSLPPTFCFFFRASSFSCSFSSHAANQADSEKRNPPPPYPALQRIHSAARNSPPHAPRGNSRKKITKSNQTHTPKYPRMKSLQNFHPLLYSYIHTHTLISYSRSPGGGLQSGAWVPDAPRKDTRLGQSD